MDSMSMELKYHTFNTHMGWVCLLASKTGLLGITFPQASSQQALQMLGDSIINAAWSTAMFDNLVERLTAYFNGHRATFPDVLDLSGATPFQRQVWEITRLVPYGETRSYLWIANKIERPGAAQAVGQALGKNPLPIIIPCHRIIASDGNLCGFGGGLEMKRKLLQLEVLG